MRYFVLSVLLSMIICSSCEIRIKSDSKEQTPETRNFITIKENGIKVDQAYLVFEDGSPVPDNNRIKENQPVAIRLVTSGWKEKEGRIFLNASEKVMSSEGDTFLDEEDMFADSVNGVSSEDVKYLNLSVNVPPSSRQYDYFQVLFRVEDKTDSARFVEGYYKLYRN